jgi:hypothetical protein
MEQTGNSICHQHVALVQLEHKNNLINRLYRLPGVQKPRNHGAPGDGVPSLLGILWNTLTAD